MLKVDLKDLKRLTRELGTAKEKAIPFAVKNSLNRSAFAARQTWQQQIEQDFVTRNRYTTRSIRVVKVRGNKPDRMEAIVGSIAPYMDTQEKGGTIRGKSRHKPIPTGYAAGQMGAVPRTKAVRRPNRLSAINLKSNTRGLSKRQRNAIAIRQSRESGNKYALIETDKGKAIVRVLGKARRGGRGKGRARGRGKIKMVYDLSRRSVRVEPTPTLKRTLGRVYPRMIEIHRDALIEQLRFHRLLGY